MKKFAAVSLVAALAAAPAFAQDTTTPANNPYEGMSGQAAAGTLAGLTEGEIAALIASGVLVVGVVASSGGGTSSTTTTLVFK